MCMPLLETEHLNVLAGVVNLVQTYEYNLWYKGRDVAGIGHVSDPDCFNTLKYLIELNIALCMGRLEV